MTVIESMNDNNEQEDCQVNGYANSKFIQGMQYALDKKIANEQQDHLDHQITNDTGSCFTKGFDAIYQQMETGNIFNSV